MQRPTPLALLLMAAVACHSARAQDVTVEPSAAQRCVQHTAGAGQQPTYPVDAFNANRGGRVQVELTFTAPDQRPQVLVLLHQGEPDLLDAVQKHVRDLRVPCLAAGAAPAKLRQDYVFQADQRRVLWANPVDADAAARWKLLTCVTHASGRRSPDYPMAAVRQHLQGRVLARLRFDSPDGPPRAEIFGRQRELTRAIEEWAKDYRLPCLQKEAVEGVFTFLFRLEGEKFGFTNVDFLSLLRLVKGIDQQSLAFDTTAMGCPFDLTMQYRRPDMLSAVGEIGTSQPARRPLLDWLAQAELNLRRPQLDAVYGDSFKITVPCARIDLKPKENS